MDGQRIGEASEVLPREAPYIVRVGVEQFAKSSFDSGDVAGTPFTLLASITKRVIGFGEQAVLGHQA